MLIGLVYDLRADYKALGYSDEDVAEFDSESTINAIDETIQGLGYETERIGNVWSLCKRLSAGEKWELVFNIAEGLRGRSRESQVPAILEAYNIGYTLSDPLVCAITLDKGFAKRIVRDHAIQTAKFKIVETIKDLGQMNLEYPLFAKPIAEGTGKGIDRNSRVESYEELVTVCKQLLEKYSRPVLVEEFLQGREFTVGILGNGKDAYVLGIMEIKLLQEADKAIYSYVTKEECEKLVQYLPCPKGSLYKQVEQIAIKSYHALECRDAARVDIRCDRKGVPCFLEINSLPGLHPTHSDLPMIATQVGMSYSELLNSIIKIALKRLCK